MRGFDYYTSTVFEVFDTHPDNRRSLYGGGRYDNLVGLYSAQRIPGFGFGMGDVTLFDFLGTHGLLPEPRGEVDAAVITAEELSDAARGVAKGLREAGVRTSTPLDVRKLGKEIQRADKAGARVVVIVGGNDWAAGTVTVRDLHTGDQQQVTPGDTPGAGAGPTGARPGHGAGSPALGRVVGAGDGRARTPRPPRRAGRGGAAGRRGRRGRGGSASRSQLVDQGERRRADRPPRPRPPPGSAPRPGSACSASSWS